MRRAIACLIYLPALIAWLLFSTTFRLAHWLIPEPRYSVWRFQGIRAEHCENYYRLCHDEPAEDIAWRSNP